MIGTGPDGGSFVFFLAWWPYATLKHLNPFITHLVWPPDGFNLASVPFAPLAATVVAPITLWAGPVPAYNLAMLISPALSAWTAFLLCRLICGRFWPALVGGYVYGFSAYMLSHMLGHLYLVMAFFPPLAVYLIIRRISGSITMPRFMILLALVLIGQIGTSLEVIAMATLFGAFALALAWWLGDQSARAQIAALAGPVIGAYLLATIVASPYFYYFFTSQTAALSMSSAYLASMDTANLLIPSSVNFFGWSRIAALCGGLNIYEAGEYLGPVAIIVVYGYARSKWHEPGTRLLIALFLITAITSLGPAVFVAGVGHVPAPWRLFARLPLFDKAEPVRIFAFSFLVLAVIVSLWLADRLRPPKTAMIGAAALMLFFLPNPSAAFWTRPIAAPPFFAQGLYRKYIAPGDTVLILPYGVKGESDVWQGMSGMYFRIAGGYVSIMPVVPSEYIPYLSAVRGFYQLVPIRNSDEAIKGFLAQKNIRLVIVADEGNEEWHNVMNGRLRYFVLEPLSGEEKAVIHSMFAILGVEPIRVGGVSLYRVPLEKLAAYRSCDLFRPTVNCKRH